MMQRIARQIPRLPLPLLMLMLLLLLMLMLNSPQFVGHVDQ
jgi:hypothetical protein